MLLNSRILEKFLFHYLPITLENGYKKLSKFSTLFVSSMYSSLKSFILM